MSLLKTGTFVKLYLCNYGNSLPLPPKQLVVQTADSIRYWHMAVFKGNLHFCMHALWWMVKYVPSFKVFILAIKYWNITSWCHYSISIFSSYKWSPPWTMQWSSQGAFVLQTSLVCIYPQSGLATAQDYFDVWCSRHILLWKVWHLFLQGKVWPRCIY